MDALQRHQLGHAQAAGIHQLEHCAVAQPQRRVQVGRFEQRLNLGLAQQLGHAQRLARILQAQARVLADALLAQGPAEIALENAQPPVRTGAAAAGMAGAGIAEQVQLSALVERQAAFSRQPAGQQRQVAAIGFERVVGQPVLEPQSLDESVDRRLAGQQFSGRNRLSRA